MDTQFSEWFIYKPLGFPRLKSREIRLDDFIKKKKKKRKKTANGVLKINNVVAVGNRGKNK